MPGIIRFRPLREYTRQNAIKIPWKQRVERGKHITHTRSLLLLSFRRLLTSHHVHYIFPPAHSKRGRKEEKGFAAFRERERERLPLLLLLPSEVTSKEEERKRKEGEGEIERKEKEAEPK